MRSSPASFRHSIRPRAVEGALERSPTIEARPPPDRPWEFDASPAHPAPIREAEATAWLLRMIVGAAAVSVAVEELVGAGPAALHAALGLPAGALVGLAVLELAAGAAVLIAAWRAGIHAIAVIFAALSVALLTAGSALALQTAFVSVCAVVLGLLDRLLRGALTPDRGGRALGGRAVWGSQPVRRPRSLQVQALSENRQARRGHPSATKR